MVHRDLPAGGSEGLLSLLDEHGEAIEFDLIRFVHVDLADWFRGLIPTRKVIRLIKLLPAEAAFRARMKASAGDLPPSARVEPWATYYAMNDTAEMVRSLWNLLAAVNTAKGKKAPTYPDPLRTAGKPVNSLFPRRGPTTK